MCLEIKIKSGKMPEPKKAKKNIWVYKIIDKDGKGWCFDLEIDGKKEGWTRGFHYIETTPFVGYSLYSKTANIEGNCFHSTGSKGYAKFLRGASEIIVRMYIPKGALYYHVKEDNLYASSELVFPEEKKKK